jgi:hypothetical protein
LSPSVRQKFPFSGREKHHYQTRRAAAGGTGDADTMKIAIISIVFNVGVCPIDISSIESIQVEEVLKVYLARLDLAKGWFLHRHVLQQAFTSLV